MREKEREESREKRRVGERYSVGNGKKERRERRKEII
jgi:hypothetical protein